MIQKTNISELCLNDRPMLIAAASTILEGDRDYGKQTLATPTFHTNISEIVCSPRSRTYGSSECESARCEKYVLNSKSEAWFIRSPKKVFAHTKNITCSVWHCLVTARIVFIKSKCLAATKQ